MTDDKPKVLQRSECVYSKHSPLCRSLDKAGVPPDPRWRTAIMHLRGLEYDPSLSLKQRAESQALLVDLLQERDFSDRRYEEFAKALEAVVTSPYREKLAVALRETTALISEVEQVLGRRSHEVRDLEEYAVGTVRAGESPEKIMQTLRTAFQRVIRDMEEDSVKLRELARTDSLTGLYNRRGFDEYMVGIAAEAVSSGVRPGMMMLDIDHFKRINDTYGHIIGDQALKVVAGKIRQCLKERCECEHQSFRYGGEEFVVVFPDMPLDELWELAEHIRRTVERYHFVVRNANGDILHKGVKFTISIGVAQAVGDNAHGLVEKLVEAADAAMYDAKVTGRNRVSLFEGGDPGSGEEKKGSLSRRGG